jgi:hypothetical protein
VSRFDGQFGGSFGRVTSTRGNDAAAAAAIWGVEIEIGAARLIVIITPALLIVTCGVF